MAEGNRHLGYKEVLNDARGPVARVEGRVPVRLPRARRTSASPSDAVEERDGTARRAPGCGAPTPARSARSAGCRSAAARRPRGAGRARPDPLARCGRPFAAGDRVLLVDTKRRRHLVTLAEGGAFHTHAGVLDHDALIGQPTRASPCARRSGRTLVAVRPTLAEYVLEDATRRAGDLPEGPRADPDARRRVPGRARPRVGRRLGRAHDDAAAGDRTRRATCSATSCATTSPTAPAATSRASSAPTSRSRSRCATSTTASTSPTSTASCSTSPSRGGS